MDGQTLVFADPAAVAEEASRRFVSVMAERAGGRFSLALSGGSTPQRFYRLLTASPWREQIDWGSLHVFLADERFLPSGHPDSNFRMIRETLIDPLAAEGRGVVKLPACNIHPMPTDGTVEDSAIRYEAGLKGFFGESPPRFDLIVLGMGPDGHTASLFPSHIHPKGPWVLPVHNSPKPPPTRLSLSLEIINQSRHVFFLVTGRDKAEALSSIRKASKETLPAGTVQLNAGELIWLVDQAAWGES
ncbi:MAG: 6-phosphogluconolactonase [Proteobacteria bacterium]|nr:6-phosphogluconolactonase [Pseudomonadota bacterium]